MSKVISKVGFITLMIVFASGCSLFGGETVKEGSLELTITELPSGANSVSVIVTRDPEKLEIVFPIVEGADSVSGVVESLAVGSWFVRVEVKDSEGGVIDSGSRTINIQAESTTAATIDLSQPSSEGIIAFVSTWDGDMTNVIVMNADGSNPFNVTPGVHAVNPALSPDGTKIAFESTRDNSAPDIFVVNVDGTGLVNLTKSTSRDGAPSWSPDGTKIVFSSSSNIAVMNSDGSGRVQLTADSGTNISPVWSPDGSKIAFLSNRRDGSTQNPYVMNSDGSNQTLLFESSASTYHIDWSPDGTKLAFFRHQALFTIDAADGGNLTQITNVDEHGSVQGPAWSPDSTRIAFNSNLHGTHDIYVINLDGSGFVNLTNNEYTNTRPTWSVGSR